MSDALRPALPRWLGVPAAAAAVFLAVPLLGMLARVPWPRLPAVLATPAAVDALWLSLRTCVLATLLAVVLGLPLALVLARARGRWAVAVRTLATVPMVLPPVVAGLALLVSLGRRAPLGGWLAAAGIDLAFTTAAVVVAQTFVAMPYLVVSVEGALRSASDDYAVAAATLGAGPTTVLRRVSLPLVAPAIGSGAALAFARALGEFGATLTFAGSLQGTTRTLPLEIYLAREADTDTAITLAVVLVGLAALLVAGTARFGRATPRPRRRTAAAPGPAAPPRPHQPRPHLPHHPGTGGRGAAAGLAVHAAVAGRGAAPDLDVPAGSVTALVGPNGAGKSTLLHLVAGLVAPTAGTVAVGETVVAGPGRLLPPHRRPVALLTQRPALFPHLDVLANTMFGPLAAGAPRAVARRRALAELEAVGCAGLASRRPDELSGGQAQRVALARALATDPQVVLLDEPLAGLDIAVAADVRHALAARLRGHTALLVTHEVLDIWTIADRVAVLDAGVVAATGPAAELLERPTTGFLARLAGTNLLAGVASAADTLDLAPGVRLRGLADPDSPPVAGGPALAAVPPAAIGLHLAEPGGSPRNVLAAEVTGVEPRGQVARVHLDLAGHAVAADLTPQAVAELGLRPGSTVRAAVKATQVRLYGR